MTSRRHLANAIRLLSIDAVQAANSGHPGAPMGLADISEVLWRKFLKHNPLNPNWINRDRFVLSNGHASMLLYSLLYLTGYNISINDLKNFRQIGSITPGHPETGETPGVETTTGPLGQGLANAVGMAIAEKMMAGHFNQPDIEIIDHKTFCFVGDGCLMEGISHEAASLAGTLGLNKLIVIYDENGISIDGKVEGWFTENISARFEAYGWSVISDVDGHESADIIKALDCATKNGDKPTLIRCKTQIGFGSLNFAGSEKAHGSPLGDEEIALVRKNLFWESPPFVIPDKILENWNHHEAGRDAESFWNGLKQKYKEKYPDLNLELDRRISKKLPQEVIGRIQRLLRKVMDEKPNLASRKVSHITIETITKCMPELIGGSADLGNSNLTFFSDMKLLSKSNSDANYINYGVREFGMAAIMNGIAVHGGFFPFGGTFLVFMDYARNAVRLAGLMKTRVIFIFTHDSIRLGEDGPTHQPIEHLTTLRGTPGLEIWRPADAVETIISWQEALKFEGPSCLVLSRQNLSSLNRNNEQVDLIQRGGYILFDMGEYPDLILISSGSEVSEVLRAAKILISCNNLNVRVVSMPSTSRFDNQSASYKESVLPKNCRLRVAVEAGHTAGWWKYVGLDGDVIGIDSFGASAPGSYLMKHFGLTPEAITERVQALIQRNSDPNER